MKNLKSIIQKLSALAATPVVMAPNQKCPGATGKIGATVLGPAPGDIDPTLTSDAAKARALEKKIQVYYGKVEQIIRSKCDSTDTCGSKSSFESCFRIHHDALYQELQGKIYSILDIDDDGTVMAAQDLKISRDTSYNPDQQSGPNSTTMTSTQRRNCELNRKRCLCQFYIAKAYFEIRSAREAEFFNAEIEKYYIPASQQSNPTAYNLAKEKNKKKFATECAKIKENSKYVSDSPCSLNAQGKHNYSDCSKFCQNCTSGGDISPEAIEALNFS